MGPLVDNMLYEGFPFCFTLIKFLNPKNSPGGSRRKHLLDKTPTKGNTMEEKFESVKKFIQRHKVAIAITTTATAFMVLQYKTAQHWNNFLIEEGLFDKYYSEEEI